MPLQMNREVFITCAVTGSGAPADGPDRVRAKLGLQKQAQVTA
ncbi:hypothetical protein [Yoonia sp. BS5-3]|uniref:Uncharacterized protein n=1 Tax=Yoonia phaeophyticola TaxID=3137369 RepID=A0ABZ2V7Q8_9RHOB